MNVILTYDLSGENYPVKTEMMKNGYQAIFVYNGNTVNLPETTLFHPSKTPNQAIEEIQRVARDHGVRVTRAIATERDGTNWQAIAGEKL